MATKSFGAEVKTADQLIVELYKEVGAEFPLRIQSLNGKITAAEYETEWKAGGTEQVEVVDKKTKEVTTEYKENYETKKLTKAQIEKADKWIKANLAE